MCVPPLAGPIPPELGALSELRELRLPNNNLTGKHFRFSGGFASVVDYHTDSMDDPTIRCAFTGLIPKELGALSKLETLWLSRNDLTGEEHVEVDPNVSLVLYFQDVGLEPFEEDGGLLFVIDR